MKRIHIVDPYESAAMNRMTQPLTDFLPDLYLVTKGEEVDLEADVNIHVPFHSMVGLEERGKGKHIVAYTHCNVGNEAHVIDACQRADLVTAMSFTGRDELISMGVDPSKVHVIYCAADQFHYRKRLVGIIGYPQPNGRKREGLIMDLAWQYDLTPYEFIFSGVGWEGMVDRLKQLGVSASHHHADTFEKLSMTMRLLDVLLVTGYREGGPLPLLECMAGGVPVLSPDLGYAADLLEPENIYNSPAELMAKLDGMFEKSFYNHKLARAWTWRDYAAEYALLIGRLISESVDLFPERGMSRYSQLLDIIDEVKPSSICEIGTWNGNNAIRMIQQAKRYQSFVSYQGFDLFETQTAEQFRRELSKRGQDENIVRKRLDATGADVELVKGDTRQTIDEILPADFYFVDGGHSEETIDNDGTSVIHFMENGVAIFDDYYHEGKPAGMGCNKFIDALDRTEFEVIHLPVRTTDALDGRVIGMVKVRRNATVSVQMPAETFYRSVTPD